MPGFGPTADRVREAWMSILGERAGRRPGARPLCRAAGRWGWRRCPGARQSVTFVELNPPSLGHCTRTSPPSGWKAATTVHRGDAMRFAERLAAGRVRPGAGRSAVHASIMPPRSGGALPPAPRSGAFFRSSTAPTSSSTATTPAATATPPSPSATRHDSYRRLPRLVRSADPGATRIWSAGAWLWPTASSWRWP